MLDRCVAENARRAAATCDSAGDFFQPYADFDVDFLYNSLFCDNLALFRRDFPLAQTEPWTLVLAEPPPLQTLQDLAGDETAPSRLRALACKSLRRAGTPLADRRIFGVIVELPAADGQDTLAAHADGSAHCIRHTGQTSSFDSDASPVAARARKLVAAAERLLQRFAAPQGQRLAPPQDARVRITLLASDGLHVSEGDFQTLQQDALAGPVLGNVIWLLQAHAHAASA
jgi:hypothetical protein